MVGGIDQETARRAVESVWHAKEHEIKAHARAAELQDRAAARLEAAGNPEGAFLARQRARAARERMKLAEAERDALPTAARLGTAQRPDRISPAAAGAD